MFLLNGIRPFGQKKWLCFLCLLLLFARGEGMAGQPSLPNDIGMLVSQYNMLLQAKKGQGMDVKQAEELDRQSQAAMAQRKPELAESLLREAIALLQGDHSGGGSASMPHPIPSGPALPIGQPAAKPVIPPVCEPVPGITLDVVTQRSPFGLFGPYQFQLDSNEVMSYEKINAYLADVGVKWVQEMPMNIGRVPASLGIYSRVAREGGVTAPSIDYQVYTAGLRQTINCYKGRVKYWEIDTEPGGLEPPMGWKGYEKEYGQFLRESYKIIKEVCPDCLVVLGGAGGIATGHGEDSNMAFVRALLRNGGGDSFDVFSFKMHHYKVSDYVQLRNKLAGFSKIFSEYGVDLMKKTLFLETASYAGNPTFFPGHPLSFINLPEQTEFQQASGLIKTYIFAIAMGVDRIFWNEIFERHDFGGDKRDPFNFYGLVHNPLNEDGKSSPKLAYYTYKKMVEVLEGSDWGNVVTLKEENGLFLYRLYHQGRAIVVAWNDTDKEIPVVIPGIQAKAVSITDAVPHVISGDAVDKNSPVFHRTVVEKKGGAVQFMLGATPVYIEEIE